MTLVTVYVDASHGAGGISAAGGRVVRGRDAVDIAGGLRHCYPSSTHAELAGIGAILTQAVRSGHVRQGDSVVIINDNDVAVRYLNGTWPSKKREVGHEATGDKTRKGAPKKRVVYEKVPKNQPLFDLAQRVLAILQEAGIEFGGAKWTRGHNLKAGTNAALDNHAVDRLARKARRSLRQAQGSSSAM